MLIETVILFYLKIATKLNNVKQIFQIWPLSLHTQAAVALDAKILKLK